MNKNRNTIILPKKKSLLASLSQSSMCSKTVPSRWRDNEAMAETAESVREHGALVPATVRDLDDDATTIIMVDSSLQCENILPTERAQAYKMKLDVKTVFVRPMVIALCISGCKSKEYTAIPRQCCM